MRPLKVPSALWGGEGGGLLLASSLQPVNLCCKPQHCFALPYFLICSPPQRNAEINPMQSKDATEVREMKEPQASFPESFSEGARAPGEGAR